jgi:hypothetical protein
MVRMEVGEDEEVRRMLGERGGNSCEGVSDF